MIKYRDPGKAIEATWSQPFGGTLYQGRDALGEFWAITKPVPAPPPKPEPKPEPKAPARTVDYEYEPHTACYCNACRMPPCSWCTDPERTEEDFNGK